MPEVQTEKKFPGYGIVYTDGVKGIKVVKTFTEGSKRIVEADGSRSFTTPPPVIHELVGGSFCYADGRLVADRTHLERLPEQMRVKALTWFDSKKSVEIPKEATVLKEGDAPKESPEPTWVVSATLPLMDEASKAQSVEPAKVPVSDDPIIKALKEVSEVVTGLSAILAKQGEDIEMMKKGVKPPGKRGRRFGTRGHPNPRKGKPLPVSGNEALDKMGLGEAK